MNKTWHDRGWDDYLYWQTQDRRTLNRINKLIAALERDAVDTIGKPEPLKHRPGYWSVRIDDANRLVYRRESDMLYIVQCRGHYDD
ncbi:MAG: Txe/YoeB family addiction module toxin [Oscillospiraceae bacterium]|jgi:toxin YoeB|nr:Txe/YoeB family addiction module toxin [Oscillospiraceae bacterium]